MPAMLDVRKAAVKAARGASEHSFNRRPRSVAAPFRVVMGRL
jgi:hypothetical protein